MNNWQTKKLGELATYINGYPFKPSDWSSEGLPIIRIQNLNDETKEFNYFTGTINSKYFVQNGDILISWSASLGSYLWQRGNGWLNQHIFKVVVNDKVVNKDFFFYLSQTVLKEMRSKTHGGTMKHITKGQFENIRVSIPPKSIQHKIVERLDAIRKLQELNQQEIEKAEELFKSVLYLNFKNRKNWKRKQLGDISENLDRLRVPVSGVERANRKGNIPYYGANCQIGWIDDYIFDETLLLVAEDGGNWGPFEQSSYIIHGKSWVNNHAHVLKIKNNMLLRYLNYYLNFIDLRKYITGTTRGKLNQNALNSIVIWKPSGGKIKRIVTCLDSINSYKKTLEEEKEKLSELFESMLNKTMRGELYFKYGKRKY